MRKYEAKTKQNHVLIIYIHMVMTGSKRVHWLCTEYGTVTQSFLIGITIRPVKVNSIPWPTLKYIIT